MTITAREAGSADEADWRRLWSEWQAHMRGRVPDDVSDEAWRQIIDPSAGLRALVLRNNSGKAIGFANISSTPFAWTASSILFLQDFFISETERGTGAGAFLLEAVYAFADTLGATQVFWMVDEADDRLQAFYSRHAVRTPYLRYMRRPWPW